MDSVATLYARSTEGATGWVMLDARWREDVVSRVTGTVMLDAAGRQEPMGKPAVASGEGWRHVRMLDGFEVRCCDGSVTLPRGAQRLVAFLALNPRPVSRSYAAGTLWIDYTDERAMANLRSALWRIRQSGCHLVDSYSGFLRLASGISVDVWSLARLGHRLLDPTDSCSDELGTCSLEALTADLLPDWQDDEWLIAEREHLRQLRLHALEALANRLIALDRRGQAVAAALAAVHMEPLQESARAALIRAHLLGGNRCQALRQFEQYAALLKEELHLEPSHHLSDLVEGFGRR